MYRALRQQGVAVQLLQYPRDNHGPFALVRRDVHADMQQASLCVSRTCLTALRAMKCCGSTLCSKRFSRYSPRMDLSVNADWSYCGLRAVVLENRLLRVVVLPEAGARIWQITHKPTDTDLLWNNPRMRPSRLPMNSRYDDVWSGGWDELFPNDEVALIDGEAYPDHGELWTGQWQAEPFARGDEVGVHLRFVTPISAIAIEKTMVLRRDSAQIAFRHVFRNAGTAPFPFMWKLHPALAVTENHRIDFPAMKVVPEPTSPGTLVGAPPSFDWPYMRRQDGSTVDLRRIPPADARQMYFFYGTEMQAGWCALTNTATRLACALVFDPAIFSHCWLFASYGGWRSSRWIRVVRDDVQLHFIVTGMKERSNLFAIKSAPFIVMACHFSIDRCGKFSAYQDMQARCLRLGIEMKNVTKMRRGGRGYVHGV